MKILKAVKKHYRILVKNPKQYWFFTKRALKDWLMPEKAYCTLCDRVVYLTPCMWKKASTWNQVICLACDMKIEQEVWDYFNEK